MAWIDIDEYLDMYSKRSRPKKEWVWRWIREGKLSAVKHGRKYYIDSDKIEPRTGNALVDKVLKK